MKPKVYVLRVTEASKSTLIEQFYLDTQQMTDGPMYHRVTPDPNKAKHFDIATAKRMVSRFNNSENKFKQKYTYMRHEKTTTTKTTDTPDGPVIIKKATPERVKINEIGKFVNIIDGICYRIGATIHVPHENIRVKTIANTNSTFDLFFTVKLKTVTLYCSSTGKTQITLNDKNSSIIHTQELEILEKFKEIVLKVCDEL